MILLELLYNLSLLVALSVISGFLYKRYPAFSIKGSISQGLLFGIVTIIGMMRPLVFSEGLIFDGRSVVLSVSALFFGPVSGAIAGIMALIFRLYQGGSGTVPGTLVIISSVIIGTIFYLQRKKTNKELTVTRLLYFGLTVHIAMLLMMFSLPFSTAISVIQQIGLPVIISYPLATILIGKILIDQEINSRVFEDIKANEIKYRYMFDNNPQPMFIYDLETLAFLEINNSAISHYGYTREEFLSMTIKDIRPKEDIEALLKDVELTRHAYNPAGEWRHVKKNGEIINVEIISHSITFHNRSARHVMVNDITNRKRTELERQILFEITNVLTTNSNQDDLIKLIHSALQKAIYAENFFVALYDKDSGLYNFPYFVDKFDPTPHPVAMKKSCTAYVFRTGKPLLLTQELFDQLVAQDEVELVGSNSPSWIGAPLITQSGIIGVLVLQHYEKENVYSEPDVDFLVSVANQIAIVMERKIAEETLRESEEKFRTIFDESPIGIELYKTDGMQVAANRASLKMFGILDQSEILGFNLFEGTSLDVEKTEKLHRGESVAYQVVFDFEKVKQLKQYKTNRVGKAYFDYIITPLSDKKSKTLNGFLLQVQDITNRKQTEEELRKERLLLRTVIDNIPDSIYCKDTSFRKTLSNKSDLRYMGVNSESEILGKTDFDLYSKEHAEKSFAVDQTVINSGKSILNTEELLLDENGQKQWLLTSKLPMKDEKGDIIGIVGIGRNITERRRNEEALTESERRYRTVLEQSLEAIYLYDLKTRMVLEANPAFCDLLGYSVEEVKTLTLYDIVANDKFSIDTFMQKLSSTGGMPLGERIWRRKDGSDVQVEVTANKIELGGREILFFVGRDITDRKKAEQSLKESEIKLNVILQSTADGILAIDANGKVIKTNERFAQLWRIPQRIIESGDSKTLLDSVLGQLIDPDKFISKVKMLYNSSDEDLDQIYFKDGRIFERYSAPLIMPDKSLGRVWSFRDITKQKHAEEEINSRNKQLSTLNAEKDKFFSIIAHDLKSPFNGFLNLTELMAQRSDDFSLAEFAENSKLLNESARNLYKLLENLLTWAQMQRDTITFIPKEFNLYDTILQNIEIINQRALQKGITIINEVPAFERIYADEKMVDTIFRNLLSNAVKFTGKGGKVFIKSVLSDNDIIITIEDTGIGIPENDIEKLFKIEEKVSTAGTEGESSTGIGLLLCKEFIERNGGNIWVESEKGKGSKFIFTLLKSIS